MPSLRAPFTASLVSLSLISFHVARGAISYSVPGSTYSENFNSLPADAPNNASIETVYTNGWRDDTATVAGTHVSLPGWYLFHPLSPAAENGFNGNQRLRMGTGANTGAFWAFSAPDAANADKALGTIGSNTMADPGVNMFWGLRLTNDSLVALDTFTLTFDAEQWRDGQSAAPETMTFDYSATATLADWNSPTGPFTAVPSLSFTSPVFTGVAAAGTALDGNLAANRTADLTATITGISWAPGTDLWLRWADANLAAFADDGLAIDNVRFVANFTIPEPAGPGLLGLGAVTLLGVRRRRR